MAAEPRRVFVLTGAGISAESGIPTFRGDGGYWRNRDPAKLATREAFEADPELVWQWYRERRALIRSSEPNAAHRALVRLAAAVPQFLLVTQNVDDLHTRADWNGQQLSAGQLVQIHGDIFLTRCLHCDFSRKDETGRSGDAGVPRCPKCGSMMRPGVVWFDEDLDPLAVRRVDDYVDQGPCDLVLAIGTTASFDYVLDWARRAARSRGHLVEINPDTTLLTPFASEAIRAPAGTALPDFVTRVLAGSKSVPRNLRPV